MFERFTDRARNVIVLAQKEARLQDHSYVGTEHLLAALVDEGRGAGGQVLTKRNITVEKVRSAIKDIHGKSCAATIGHMPFSPRLKKVLELSFREALAIGHNYIGTEHLLLGIAREGEGPAAQILVKLGYDNMEEVKSDVIAHLGKLPNESRLRPDIPPQYLNRPAEQSSNLQLSGPDGTINMSDALRKMLQKAIGIAQVRGEALSVEHIGDAMKAD